MTDAALSASPPRKSVWKRRTFALLFWFAVALLVFRPVLVADWQTLTSAESPAAVEVSPSSPTPAQDATVAFLTTPLAQFAADLIALAAVCACLLYVLSTQIGSIARNTFREAVRNRVLYFILFFALILMGASGVIKELANEAQAQVVLNLGLASINFFGLMVAVFVGISLVYNEIEKKTIYTIVSKPVARWQFLLGKFFGLLLTVYVIVAVMAFFFFTVMNYQAATTDENVAGVFYQRGADGLLHEVENIALVKTVFVLKAAGASALKACANVAGFAAGAVSQDVLLVVAMTFLELLVVTAFAILFSSFSTPTLSAVLTVLVFLAGRRNEDIMRFAWHIAEEAMKNEGATRVAELSMNAQVRIWFARIASWITPNLDSLNLQSQAVFEQHLQVWRYGVLYAFCYTAGVLALSMLIFNRRNFK